MVRLILAGLLLVVALAIGAWDIYVTARGETDATVSRTLWDWGRLYPILPLAIGVILGHCFWPQIAYVYLDKAR